MGIPARAVAAFDVVEFEDRGIVDQQAERPQRGGGTLDQRSQCALFCQIGLQRDGAAAGRGDLRTAPPW